MQSVQAEIERLAEYWKAHFLAPFPYDDVRALKHDPRYKRLLRGHIIEADLNEYMACVEGLASGGIRRFLGPERHRLDWYRDRLSKPFVDVYPQYAFLKDVHWPDCPLLKAQLDFVEDLRQRLLHIVALDDRARVGEAEIGGLV